MPSRSKSHKAKSRGSRSKSKRKMSFSRAKRSSSRKISMSAKDRVNERLASTPGRIISLSFTVVYGIGYEFDEDKFNETGGMFGIGRIIKNGEITGHKYTFDFKTDKAFKKFFKEYKRYFHKG